MDNLANPQDAKQVLGNAKKVPRRVLAAQLSSSLRKTTFRTSRGKKIGRGRQLADMITELAINRQTTSADGTVIEIDDKQWLELVKFVYAHIDGPSGNEPVGGPVAIFKVYAGFDVDRV